MQIFACVLTPNYGIIYWEYKYSPYMKIARLYVLKYTQDPKREYIYILTLLLTYMILRFIRKIF